MSVMAKNCLTVRPKSQTGTNVGHSDPVIFNEKLTANVIKGTLGITGL